MLIFDSQSPSLSSKSNSFEVSSLNKKCNNIPLFMHHVKVFKKFLGHFECCNEVVI